MTVTLRSPSGTSAAPWITLQVADLRAVPPVRSVRRPVPLLEPIPWPPFNPRLELVNLTDDGRGKVMRRYRLEFVIPSGGSAEDGHRVSRVREGVDKHRGQGQVNL